MEYLVTKDLRLLEYSTEPFDVKSHVAAFASVVDAVDFIEAKIQPLINNQKKLYRYLTSLEDFGEPQIVEEFHETSKSKVEEEIQRLESHVAAYRKEYCNDY